MRITCLGRGVLLLAVLVVVPTCGGGGGGEATPPPDGNVFTGLAFSIPNLDGWAMTNGQYSTSGSSAPWAGDIDTIYVNAKCTTYYSFNITGIPANAEILEATLSVYVVSTSGDPYGKYGPLTAGYRPYGNDLANVIGSVTLNPPPPVTFSPANGSPGTKEASVIAHLERALQEGSGMYQVSVGFPGLPNADGVNEWSNLTDAENLQSAGAVPMLSLTWREP